MAKPRIFISSTFYDLQPYRWELDKFISSMGYEAIRNEEGHIPYGNTKKLEEYCYREIGSSDILVSIIGGRFGSESNRSGQHSISNMELKVAHEQKKQIYIFIENNVLSEYRTYQKNKNHKDIQYSYIDNIKIYQFIDELYNLRYNNNIKNFSKISDITDYLREQWAGLFKEFLNTERKEKEFSLINQLDNTSNTLNQLVNKLIHENKNNNKQVEEILFSNHPAFVRLKELLSLNYTAQFYNISQLIDFLGNQGFRVVQEPFEYSKPHSEDSHFIFDSEIDELFIDSIIFDKDGKTKIIPPSEWNDKFIQLLHKGYHKPSNFSEYLTNNDDIPF